MNEVRSLLISLLDNEDNETKNFKEIMPYVSILFEGLTGRYLFISKALIVSQTDWAMRFFSGALDIRTNLLRISPGDIVAGDVIVRFSLESNNVCSSGQKMESIKCSVMGFL
jgi:hypothetical protein